MRGQFKPRNRARTRASILQAAELRFGAQGYEQTSMREIADDTNLSVSTLYHYFPSKQALLRELFTTYYQALHQVYADVDQALSDDATLRQALLLFTDKHRRFLASHAHFAKLFFWEGLRPSSPIQATLADLARPATRTLRRLAKRWPAVPGAQVLTAFIAASAMSIFFQAADNYVAQRLGKSMRVDDQLAVFTALLSGHHDLEQALQDPGVLPPAF